MMDLLSSQYWRAIPIFAPCTLTLLHQPNIWSNNHKMPTNPYACPHCHQDKTRSKRGLTQHLAKSIPCKNRHLGELQSQDDGYLLYSKIPQTFGLGGRPDAAKNSALDFWSRSSWRNSDLDSVPQTFGLGGMARCQPKLRNSDIDYIGK